MNLAPTAVELIGTGLFAVAVLHTFCTGYFEHLARRSTRHAGVWHLLGEVEVVFGFWALVLVLCMAAISGTQPAITYLEQQNFTEPLFVFVILVMAGSRPILSATRALIDAIERRLPLPATLAGYFLTLTLIPLLGSFITEPAAMTLAALILRERFYARGLSTRFEYATLAVLLVNVSIGGVLTPYAAPPVLMVASTWGWDIGFMSSVFGWKAALAVLLNAGIFAVLFRRELTDLPPPILAPEPPVVPFAVIAVHLLFLLGTVLTSHQPAAFIGLFLFFLGYTEAYRRHQDGLLLREGLLVGFFLAGLVVLGK